MSGVGALEGIAPFGPSEQEPDALELTDGVSSVEFSRWQSPGHPLRRLRGNPRHQLDLRDKDRIGPSTIGMR